MTTAQTCRSCGKEFVNESEPHAGYGAGSGTVDTWDVVCTACEIGHIHHNRDSIPGFRDHWIRPCCNCGADR
jgi:hypothetical protein